MSVLGRIVFSSEVMVLAFNAWGPWLESRLIIIFLPCICSFVFFCYRLYLQDTEILLKVASNTIWSINFSANLPLNPLQNIKMFFLFRLKAFPDDKIND